MIGRKLKVCMTEDAGYVPEYVHEGDAGLDLRAVEEYVIPAGKSVMARTGLRVEIPTGCVGLEFPRSGLGAKGITLRNCVGVIDSGYRGEVLAALWNTTDKSFKVEKGDRVCQLVVMPFCPCTMEQAESLSESERGTDGYGSTGVR
jgi:dUTP pyrophosphatase